MTNISGTEFICTLPEEKQQKIKSAIERILPSFEGTIIDVCEIMSGRLCDLEPYVDWKKEVEA